MGKLNVMAVKAAKEAGRYGDGHGLYLVVAPSGSASWIVRVQKAGKRRDIGLGSAQKVTLAKARELAAHARSQVEAGIDPVAERKKAVGVPTFREAASFFHAEQKKAWRNAKHRDQWLSTLTTYAYPAIGHLPVNAVEASHVLNLLEAIWLTKNETAQRVRQRINSIIDWSVGKGFREAGLPMPVINRALPKTRQRRGHHAAMPHADLPAFLLTLREKETWGRLALEAAILTAARSGEIRGATWDEVNLETGIWTIPGERMKAHREHVVPLSNGALAVFSRARCLKSQRAKFIFEGMRPQYSMSDHDPFEGSSGYGCGVHGARLSLEFP